MKQGFWDGAATVQKSYPGFLDTRDPNCEGGKKTSLRPMSRTDTSKGLRRSKKKKERKNRDTQPKWGRMLFLSGQTAIEQFPHCASRTDKKEAVLNLPCQSVNATHLSFMLICIR